MLASTRLEWVQCDAAIVNIGSVTVGIYHSLLAADCSYVVQHSDAVVLFVEDPEQLEKILSVRAEMPGLRRIVIFDGPGDESRGAIAWSDFMALGESVADSELERRNRTIEPDDLASLGIENGTFVKLSTRRNTITVKALSSTRTSKGSVFMPFSYREAAANLLTTDELDPDGKIPSFKYAALKVEQA